MESPFSNPVSTRISSLPARKKKQRLDRLLRATGTVQALPPLPQIPGLVPLRPGDPLYDKLLLTYNQRTAVRPALRALCQTPASVASILGWVKQYALPFAIRSGGHSFEGYSNSSSVVIDLRGLTNIAYDTSTQTIAVGAGVLLGDIYKKLSNQNAAFAAGSCPFVGVVGHTLGGGYGLLARAYGLCCDNLKSITIVDANLNSVTASATANADLFWASRGGAGGSLGIVTGLTFATHKIGNVVMFRANWSVPAATARDLIKAWQAWAPDTTNAITALLKVSKVRNGKFSVRCIGQSITSETETKRQLDTLTGAFPPPAPAEFTTMSFFDAVKTFAGHWPWEPETGYFKERSDLVPSLTDQGIDTLLAGLNGFPANRFLAILSAYGGAINATANSASAFPYRSGTKLCMHYYLQWSKPADTASRMADMARWYDSMRPFVPGAAYVNYCDAELADWENAYWGPNLPRLKSIKKQYDPSNLFRYAQSIRLP